MANEGLRGPRLLTEIASPFDVIVLDQWGVLHNGSLPYPGAVEAFKILREQGKRLAVLSNSGKRSDVNRARITNIGFEGDLIEVVMTSGEAFWQDCHTNAQSIGSIFPITANPGDFDVWNEGLGLARASTVEAAEAVLLMGLPEGSSGVEQRQELAKASSLGLTVYCTNPDRHSPRAGGDMQVAPGSLAHEYQEGGGEVVFYGKPHRPIFETLCRQLAVRPSQCLMVGDSMEHDVAGAHAAGMTSAFVVNGLYADAFVAAEDPKLLAAELASHIGTSPPSFLVGHLSDPIQVDADV